MGTCVQPRCMLAYSRPGCSLASCMPRRWVRHTLARPSVPFPGIPTSCYDQMFRYPRARRTGATLHPRVLHETYRSIIQGQVLDHSVQSSFDRVDRECNKVSGLHSSKTNSRRTYSIHYRKPTGNNAHIRCDQEPRTKQPKKRQVVPRE